MTENDDKRHADSCERQFASELTRRTRQWKWLGKPEKR